MQLSDALEEQNTVTEKCVFKCSVSGFLSIFLSSLFAVFAIKFKLFLAVSLVATSSHLAVGMRLVGGCESCTALQIASAI